MISILIPVYDYKVTALVKELHRQGVQLGINFEIFIFDDGSRSAINKVNENLNKLENVQFHSLEKNVGLSENRNRLARASHYDNLLFIDGDSLVRENFLRNYCHALNRSTEVVYGGRTHPEDYPDKSNLRWKYGTYIEDKTAKERTKNPYRSTLFNNTLIKKHIFHRVGFEKSLTKYGHEDTLFSYELKQLQVNIQHIENPVIHNDIDSNETFLNKTQLGLNNLKKLCQSGMMDPDYVKLSKFYSKLKKTGADKILRLAYDIGKVPIKKNLTSKKPSLWIFSLYRLMYFCKINA